MGIWRKVGAMTDKFLTVYTGQSTTGKQRERGQESRQEA